ncbi:MIP/aquaporin family protein [Mycobacterium sp. 050134]|uniref:MIP/aquaporin family protein n=1 Tax=Mycobacterium sp. 050134 TaxID=3096111 RepID=UPI002EDAA790
MARLDAMRALDSQQPAAAGPPAARDPRPAAKYAVEAIGTFFLVFTCGAAVGSGSTLAPLAIGGVLMVMVYAGGQISGGHYNPAVTLAVLVRRGIGPGDAARYWIAQSLAGVIAAAAVRWIVGPVHPAGPEHRPVAVFAVEALFTFALCYVVLNVATSRRGQGNSYFGLAIGFTVVSGAFAVGGISGGAFNPAVAIAAVAMGMIAWPALWIYLAAQGIAAAGAGIAFLLLDPDQRRSGRTASRSAA